MYTKAFRPLLYWARLCSAQLSLWLYLLVTQPLVLLMDVLSQLSCRSMTRVSLEVRAPEEEVVGNADNVVTMLSINGVVSNFCVEQRRAGLACALLL